MKKKMSFIISIAMALFSVLFLFSTTVPAAHSADENALLKAGNIELSDLCNTKIEVRDDSVYIGMFNVNLNVATADDFSCSYVENDGYYFKPAPNGKYQISFICGGTYFDQQECSYIIECHDNNVDIRFNSFIDSIMQDKKFIANITTADNKSAQYEINPFVNLIPIFCYNMHLFFDTDYWLNYSVDRGNGTLCQAMYIPFYNNDDFAVVDDSTFVDIAYSKYEQSELLPEGSPVPKSIFSIDIGYWYPMTGITIPDHIPVSFISVNGYDTSYISFDTLNDYILPSTIRIQNGTDYDLNLDKKFNIADVVMLQKQLLGAQFDWPKNWRAADICRDGIIDVFDLVAMKKALIASQFA